VALLDVGNLPVEALARLGARESWRPRPIYHAHRWFGRRLGTAFRALLTAAALPPDGDFWDAYYRGASWAGRTVLDPFVGGGTTLFEAHRLGASVVGADVDPVACAITRFELRAASTPDLAESLDGLKQTVGGPLRRFYTTRTPEGELREVLHYFWVQVVGCEGCGREVEAHPHFQLGYEAEGTQQWAFCSRCHDVQQLDRHATELRCEPCGLTTSIRAGTVDYGRLTCPDCGRTERLIEVGRRTARPPTWRLFATETIEREPDKRGLPMSARRFRPATDFDHELVGSAEAELLREVAAAPAFVPTSTISTEGRSDGRLPAYGYRRYAELFGPRQLLHLGRLAREIAGLPAELREPLGLAFSDHLATNCMLTAYAFGWRRLAPLFAIRAYRHVPRPVEINPWLDRVGRGTFPNAVRQLQRAVDYARAPKEPLADGGFRSVADLVGTPERAASVRQIDARRLDGIPERSVDLILTDPPYFDNIAYSELSEFFLPWLEHIGVVGASCGTVAGDAPLAVRTRDRDAAEQFGHSLGECLRRAGRTLREDGRLVFTYRHQAALGWLALGIALGRGGYEVVQVFPLLGEVGAGNHAHEGTATWDAVVVAKIGVATAADGMAIPNVPVGALHLAKEHCAAWSARLSIHSAPAFREPDRLNFRRASIVAGAFGMFGEAPLGSETIPLDRALEIDGVSGGSLAGERGRCRS
jgi:putative DNA methylase